MMWQMQSEPSNISTHFQSLPWNNVPYLHHPYGSPSTQSPILPTLEPTHEKACTRCKKLKIKCEMRSIEGIVFEPCRRCVNGNHACTVPVKTDRKIPVKRSDLMSKIQDQATQIQNQATRIQELEAAIAKCACTTSSHQHHTDLSTLQTCFDAGYNPSVHDYWSRDGAFVGSPTSSASPAGSSASEPPSPQHTSLKHATSHMRDRTVSMPSLSRTSSTGSVPPATASGLAVPASEMDSAFDVQGPFNSPVDHRGQLFADYNTSSLVGWNGY